MRLVRVKRAVAGRLTLFSLQCAVNVADLITLDAVQADSGLGPNGGLVYAMEYVAANLDWLQERLKPLLEAGTYLIVDCPGQVELFNVHDALFKVVSFLTDKLHIRCAAACPPLGNRLTPPLGRDGRLTLSCAPLLDSTPLCSRLTAVHLVDSHLCAEPGKYLSAVLLSLTTMLHLGLPHVNVLSKIDLLPTYGPLAFGLDFYAGHGDMARLAAAINSQPGMGRYAKLTRSLCELCEDYKLVSFTTLDVQDEASMRRLVATVDKSNGYVFTAMERKAKAAGGPVSMPQMCARALLLWGGGRRGD